MNIINTTEKSDIGFVNICTYISENCPELKESEDERIRKALIELVRMVDKNPIHQIFGYGDIKYSDMIAWLERQGTPAKLSGEAVENLDKLKIMTTRKILEQCGFEPDKTVATMTEEQLYNLIKIAVARTISHNN